MHTSGANKTQRCTQAVKATQHIQKHGKTEAIAMAFPPKLAITMAILPFSIGWAAAAWQQPANQKKPEKNGELLSSHAM